MRRGANRTAAIGLVACSALAVAVLAAHALQLQRELSQESAQLAEQRSRAAASALNRLSLPPARPLAVCNDSSSAIAIPVLSAVYPGPRGAFVSYDSASDTWRSWVIPAGSVEKFSAPGPAPRAWDGGAMFFVLDVASGNTRRMFAGTSGDLTGGCLHITAEKMRQGN